MRCRTRSSSGRADEQELATGRVLVGDPADDVPDLRDLLPLIYQQRPDAAPDQLRVRLDGGAVRARVQPEHSVDALLGSGRLAHRLRAVDGDGRDLPEQVVQLVIDDPTEILHGRIIQLAGIEPDD